MKRNYAIQLFIVLILNIPFYLVGQTSTNNLISYQKTLNFNVPKNENQAIDDFKKAFALDENTTFVQFQTNIDKRGVVHQKFQQYYNGIKVEYGTMIIHSTDGNVSSINGELYNPSGLNLTTKITSKEAFERAVNHVKAQSFLWDDAQAAESMQYKKPEGELIIFPILNNGQAILTLAYKFDIYATNPVSRGDVYIDAQSGDFLYNEPIIKHYNKIGDSGNKYVPQNKNAKSDSDSFSSTFFASGSADTRYSGTRTILTRAEGNGTFTLNDDTRNVHTYNAQNAATNSDSYLFTTVDFVDNDNNWTVAEFDNAAKDNAALDAHWGAIEVHDFWAGLGRNSWNNAGAEIRSYVHLGTNYFNAFWNGSVMSYGDGSPNPLTAIDIVGHEIAHAVTTTTANLVYARESGGMNEAFSDIFGAAIEFFAKGNGSDLSPNAETWLIGEDIGSALRSMSDPKSKGDPDTYNGTFYIDASSNCIPVYSGPDYNDGCGVHTNSGVLNHWFYVLVSGEAGTNDAGDVYNVTGIGMAKAQEIAYLTLRDYLSPNSTFIDARNSAVEVASSLYGSNSTERKAVQDAFFAVNLGDEFIPFATDLKLVQFINLVDITCGEAVIPIIKVRNSGATNAINNIQVNYSVDGAAQTPYNWSGTLAVDAEIDITLPAINESAIKSYNLTVQSVVSGDGDPTNNNLATTFKVNKVDNNPSQVNPFNFFYQNWLTYNEAGGSNLWVIGAPNKTKLNSVTSGTTAYVTSATNLYPNATKAYLVTPCYDLTTLTNPIMKFNMAFELQLNFDIINIEYSTDAKNWIILGSATDPNWYNSDRKFESPEISTDCQICPGAQWTGSSSGFNQYSYDLVALMSEPKINFRFVFQSDASGNDEGVVIDDFVIEESALSVSDFYLSQLAIYPNPSSDSFTISFKNGYNDIGIHIFDVLGKMVLNKSNVLLENGKYTLDMSRYPKGLYFVKIDVQDIQIVKKLILK